MAKAVGLDIGSRSVKLIEIDGSPKKFRVTRFVSRDIPVEGGPEVDPVVQTVAEVMKAGKVNRDSLVASIDAGAVVIREILVPFLQDDQIRRVLRFEAEAHLHSYAIEDVVVDYLKVGEIQDQSKILIFAAPKERVRERLALLNQNGVDPMHLDLDLAAIFNAAQAVGAFEEHPDCVLLDIGATTTNILFIKEGELKSCRSLRTGAESLTRVISQDLAVDEDSARERAEEGDQSARKDDLLVPIFLDEDKEAGDEDAAPRSEQSATELENAIVTSRQTDFISRIHREATRSLSIYSADTAVGAIYLSGAASLARGVKERLEEQFRKPVIRLDFLGKGSHSVDAADHEKANAGMGIALGCALKLLGHEGLTLEFRRDELRYTRKFDLIKVALASTVSLIFILLFLTWLNYQNTLKTRTYEFDNILRHLDAKYVGPTKKMYEDVLTDGAKPLPANATEKFRTISTWQNQIRVMDRHITTELGFDVQGIPPIRSALEVWKELFEQLSDVRQELGYLFLDDLKISQKSASFEGLIENRGNVDLIDREMSKLDYVSEVRRDKTTVDKTKKFKFGITADLDPTKARGTGK